MSFLSTLFTGNNPTLNTQTSALSSLSGSTASEGLSDVGTSGNFFRSILNGSATKVLAPQISSIQKQGQQKLQTLSQFGNRSGGTNAAAQTAGDTTLSSINDLIASLTGTAAGALGSEGSGLLNTSINASNSAVNDSQMKLSNIMNSILGKGIGGAVNYAESFLPIAHGG